MTRNDLREFAAIIKDFETVLRKSKLKVLNNVWDFCDQNLPRCEHKYLNHAAKACLHCGEAR